MRRFLTPVVFTAFVGLVCAAEPVLEPIFNGRDLTGWQSPEKERFWRVEDGILVGESAADLKASDLWTEQIYGDFVLAFDVRWGEKSSGTARATSPEQQVADEAHRVTVGPRRGVIDSGVKFRQPVLEVQLGMSNSLKRDMTGSFYAGAAGYTEAGQAKTAAQLMHPEGEWNAFRLEAIGDTFTVWINGQRAVRYTNENFPAAGPIGFPIHSGFTMKVEFRNIRAAKL